MTEKICSSCKKNITNIEGSAIFQCPSCGKENFVRCGICRANAAKFKCTSCGFVGPN